MRRTISWLAVSAVLALAFVQPAAAQEAKAELSFEDYKEIMELADRVEAAFLLPDTLLLLEVTRPEHGLFIDLLSDSKDAAVVVEIPFSGIPDMFSDFEDKYWGPHDAADFDLYGKIPYTLLCGSIRLVAEFPEDKDRYSQVLSLPDAFARYDSKDVDSLVAEPANHSFAYENEHYVQYYVQSPISEVNGEFWFLIVDKDEEGWFLKGITHMERWSI